MDFFYTEWLTSISMMQLFQSLFIACKKKLGEKRYTVSYVQKWERLRVEKSQKQRQLEELWQHKQHKMQEEEQKLTVENEV